MDFRKKQRSNQYMVVIGCGRLGASLANAMSDSGGDILIMDARKDAFRKLSPSFGGLTLVANGTDFDALQEAQIRNADVVVAVTNCDTTNIMIAQLVREVFGVQNVIARVYDPEREELYRELGIQTICPSVLSAQQIHRLLTQNQEVAV